MQVREATPADFARCAEIEFLEPSTEMVAFMPSIGGTRRLTEALLPRSDVLVADDDGTVVGFVERRTGSPGRVLMVRPGTVAPS